MANLVMSAKDTLNGALAKCYITLEGQRLNLMNAISLEATFEKTKEELAILGKMAKGNKATGGKGSGNMSVYYNMSTMRKLAVRYMKTGEDFYFDLQITNEDPTSSVGRQTTILKDCNFDSMILAQFDADATYLTEDLDFTFEDAELPEEFALLEGMLV